jgi:coenzyme F420 hydrogenase subunit beta
MDMSEIRKVVEGGYCIGCGVCSAVSNGTIQINLNDLGMYEAKISDDFGVGNPEAITKADYVCPFTGKGPNETEIAERIFPHATIVDPKAGRYSYAYAGWAVEGQYREYGTSGGLVSWFLCELLRMNMIDAVIHVKPRNNSGGKKLVFDFGISDTEDEIRSGAKTRYYPVSYVEIIDFIEGNPGKYALTGLPCFVKALRLLSDVNNVIRERIGVIIGLVCGHLKSSFYLDMIAWQLGISLNNMTSFDFRKKIECDDAHTYGVEAHEQTPITSVKRQAFARDLYGTNWGYGFLKYHACDFCDDVLAETADVVFGDAWIPKYDKDWRGTNIIVIRRPELEPLFSKAFAENRIHLENLSLDALIDSQAGSFRHRRKGLAIRLAEKQRIGEWAPPKRVKAVGTVKNVWEYQTHVMRMKMSSYSHIAFQEAVKENNFEVFKERMYHDQNMYQRAMMVRNFFRGDLKPLLRYAKAVVLKIARMFGGALKFRD